MAIAKPMTPFDNTIEPDDDTPEIEIISADDASVTPTEDGGVIIEFGEGDVEVEIMARDHNENLAEFIPDGDLESMASELIGDFLSDRNSRGDWADSYIKGLDLLGMKLEDRTQPWEGASGVYHPMLMEAAIHFQAQAMGELMPASGPARTKIMGKITVLERELAVLAGGIGARLEGDEGTECQQGGETGHEWIGRCLETMARRLSTPG
jgi:hypothetical protein